MMDVLAADAIGKLPDRNAAEAVQRMQGVAVARYHGEADAATVRGTPFAWTSTMFNGSRLPAPMYWVIVLQFWMQYLLRSFNMYR
ncbi:TonB-dependent receptor plug domain-containing protein [Paraflavitalea speifideaquila]|uniref:TonB-dependent receptor plug domain-containing protein n=1 Tax=Paraflavitalea speifideaquila TaxID=3076558 RepID=UPI0028ED1EFB|nr:TonB-dependent receptor plug domain-containing protein [Paraflavitalea speifideiaquila]